MTGADQPGDDVPAEEPGPWTPGPGDPAGAPGVEEKWRGERLRARAEADPETAELVAEIRSLAGRNPDDVAEVVADVLAALDRVTDGALGRRIAGTGNGRDEHPAGGDDANAENDATGGEDANGDDAANGTGDGGRNGEESPPSRG